MAYASAYLAPRRLLVWFTLLALALRALIPVGYMPDFSGEGHGILPLMFCDGMDHGTIDADMKMDGMSAADMAKMHHHHHDHAAGHGLCPFGASALFEFSGVGHVTAVAPVYWMAESLRFVAWLWQGRIAFSNVSARAPPAILPH